MPDTRFDVLTIGNAIVDIMAHTEDDFLVDQGLARGSMRLVDAEEADRLYTHFVDQLRPSGLPVATGVFRAMMDVSLVNQGPVTILLDSRKQF